MCVLSTQSSFQTIQVKFFLDGLEKKSGIRPEGFHLPVCPSVCQLFRICNDWLSYMWSIKPNFTYLLHQDLPRFSQHLKSSKRGSVNTSRLRLDFCSKLFFTYQNLFFHSSINVKTYMFHCIIETKCLKFCYILLLGLDFIQICA